MNINSSLEKKIKQGIDSLPQVANEYKQEAIKNLITWLNGEEIYKPYLPQIEKWIEDEKWELLLDKFYQVIPFGTGGRRGVVGIGLNRINPLTLQSSAQGHAQYLLKKHPDINHQTIVIAYGVREAVTPEYYDSQLPNPIEGLTARKLAEMVAGVYVANGIKVLFFDEPKTTPELSFAIRHLKAIGGIMVDSSHNPPNYNGKKVFDREGGQLIPPFDEELTKEVTERVDQIKQISFEEALKKNLIQLIPQKISEAYYQAVNKLALSADRNLKIIYDPLHGPGISSVYPVLQKAGFEVLLNPATKNQSGRFENVKFNIPNPEVEESFEKALEFAQKEKADIILNTDPDADRIGAKVKHKDQWRYLNGNEIGILLTHYIIQKKGPQKGLIVKTLVTSSLIETIARKNGHECCGDLLVGFKYIAEELNKLAKEGEAEKFLLGAEESHGFLSGDYARDKDASIGALWLCELASELKTEERTLIDCLEEIYCQYGYHLNYLTEIRMLGAIGKANIQKIMDEIRQRKIENIDRYKVEKVKDFWQGEPFKSKTDKISRNVLQFTLSSPETASLKVTVRPSGTEPKIKFYFEIGCYPCTKGELERTKEKAINLRQELEKSFLSYAYQIIGVDFPERGYLLFWQLPLSIKMKYFEIENQIEKLKNLPQKERTENLQNLLKFLGSDPIEKVDQAFQKKYQKGIRQYLEIS